MRLVVMAVALTLAGSAAACGGGGAAATSQPPLTKRALIARADAICAGFNHDSAEAFSGNSTNLAAAYDNVLGSFDDAVARLSALHPPAEDRQLFEHWLAGTRAQRSTLERARQAYASGTTADQGRAVGATYLAAARANTYGARYGMSDCAVDVDTTVVPSSIAAYRTAIDGICYSASAAQDLLPQPANAAEFHQHTVDLQPVFEAYLRDLRAQPEPEGWSGRLDHFIELNQRAWNSVLDFDAAITSGDEAGFTRARRRLRTLIKRSDAEAVSAGILCTG